MTTKKYPLSICFSDAIAIFNKKLELQAFIL